MKLILLWLSTSTGDLLPAVDNFFSVWCFNSHLFDFSFFCLLYEMSWWWGFHLCYLYDSNTRWFAKFLWWHWCCCQKLYCNHYVVDLKKLSLKLISFFLLHLLFQWCVIILTLFMFTFCRNEGLPVFFWMDSYSFCDFFIWKCTAHHNFILLKCIAYSELEYKHSDFVIIWSDRL